MSRTSRWSKGLPPLRSLFGGSRPAARQREATLDVESLEERQVFAAPSVSLDSTSINATENVAALIAGSSASLTDADGDDITEMVVALSGVLDGASETLSVDSGALAS